MRVGVGGMQGGKGQFTLLTNTLSTVRYPVYNCIPCFAR